MHDARNSTSEAASAAIRDALPAPDAATANRLTQRIEERMTTAAAAAPAPLRSRLPRAARQPRVLVRPALAASAVLLAGAVALLAPGSDDASSPRGLLALGPDVAAADVLAVAGDFARAQRWNPLDTGELHYTRSVEESPDRRLEITTERWVARDGSGHSRVTERPLFVPEGETIYVPASRCFTMPSGPEPPAVFDPIGPTLPVGSAALSCWTDHPMNPLLTAATGTVVASPPDGAFTELPLGAGPVAGTRASRFGTDVLERAGMRGPIPGSSEAPILGDDSATAVPAPGPSIVPASTTWVAVESRSVVRTDRSFESPTGIAGEISPVLPSFATAFTIDELDTLPVDPGALLARLTQEAVEYPGSSSGVGATAPTGVNLVLFLTLDLLTAAPISPQVRSAAFEALGSLRLNDEAATVDRDARFADGQPAIALRFPIVMQKEYRSNMTDGDGVQMLFDPETAAFRGTVLTLNGETGHSTTYDAPRRVTEVAPLPGNARG